MFLERRLERLVAKLRQSASIPLRVELWNGRAFDLAGEEDHPRTGAEDRHPGAQEREERLADLFLTLGQIMHLVVDASVPEHTRDDAHVMGALGADRQVALQLRAVQHRIAGRALDPQPLRHRARAAGGLHAPDRREE